MARQFRSDDTSTWAERFGNGSVGRIHADYSVSISGTTTPSLDSSLDASLNDPAGGGLFFSQI